MNQIQKSGEFRVVGQKSGEKHEPPGHKKHSGEGSKNWAWPDEIGSVGKYALGDYFAVRDLLLKYL